MKINKTFFYRIIVTTLIFWLSDFIFHNLQFAETPWYYFSRLVSVLVFSAIWFLFLDYDKHWKRFVYSFIFIIWLGLYFLGQEVSSMMFLDQIVHILSFYLGLELASLIKEKK